MNFIHFADGHIFFGRTNWSLVGVILTIYSYIQIIYLVGGIPTPLKNISQLGLLFPIYGKIKKVPNRQPGIYTYIHTKNTLGKWWLFSNCKTSSRHFRGMMGCLCKATVIVLAVRSTNGQWGHCNLGIIIYIYMYVYIYMYII